MPSSKSRPHRYCRLVDDPDGITLIVGPNYSPEVTGIAPYTAGLAEALLARDGGVEVVTTHPHYPEWSRYPGYSGWRRSESVNGVAVTRLSHLIPNGRSHLQRLLSEISFGLRVAFHRRTRPQRLLLVSPALFSAAIVAIVARIRWRGTPVAVWVQDIYSSGVSETGVGGAVTAGVTRMVESALLRSADLVVVIHERFRQTVVSSLGVDNARVRVIRNWSHLPEHFAVDRTVTRRRMGWLEDETIVLHSGNMGVKQGLSSVVDAARKLTPNDRIRFVLIGDGAMRSSLEEQAKGCRYISFIDPLPSEDYLPTLASADLLLVNELPALREMAVPSKLTSYFRSGVAVIAATDKGSTTAAELQGAEAGHRVDPGDPDALIDGVRLLAANSEMRRELGSAGRRYCAGVLSSSIVTEQYADVLSNLTTRGSSRRGLRPSRWRRWGK